MKNKNDDGLTSPQRFYVGFLCIIHCFVADIPQFLPVFVASYIYVKFKEDNPDTWQEILEVHDMVDNVQSSPQTIAQRAQMFNRIKK